MRNTSALSSAGRSGRIAIGGNGVSFSTLSRTSAVLLPMNGLRPINSSYRQTPSENISLWCVSGSSRICSGAI